MANESSQSGGLKFIGRALRHRNYRLFFLGQAISLIGTWMTRIATSWLVYRLTGSAWMLGVVAFAAHAPTFLVSPLAGTLVDRWNRHRVLIATQVGFMAVALTLAALALTGVIQVAHVLALSVLEGLVRALDIPARQALVVEVVEDRDDLGNAIALNSSIFNGARLVGPSIGGVLIALWGEGVCFLIDGLSYFAVLAALLAMRIPKPLPRERPTVLHEMREGFRYTFGFAPHRAILMLMALLALMGTPYIVLMPIFADRAGGGSGTFGLMMAASGCGALAGALYLAARRTVRGLGSVIAMCGIAFGIALILFAFSPTLWLSLPLLIVTGFTMMVQMAGGNTVLQTLVDDDKRGRLMSFFAMTFMGAIPLGNLIAGSAAEWIGVSWTVAIGGTACTTGALVFSRKLPALRELARPVYIRRGVIPEVTQGLRSTSAENELSQQP